ncbi:rhoptry kinase family protein rop39 [Cystoisospora suis]|uniref:non-specific serine/threonine protein kinase n=1 Tax=Cystoisospora suis TaxID=483139 RepID=A0A2C6KY15_9APIC|nr:rhoptry kinase family protein rop39 [Cystoisospora suis]
MEGKFGFGTGEGSTWRLAACFPLLPLREKTLRAGARFVIGFLVPIWILLSLSPTSGLYPRHMPLEPTLPSPAWTGEPVSEPQVPHSKRARTRYQGDKASQGLGGTAPARAINFLSDNPGVSLLEQVPEAQAAEGAASGSQASLFHDLASDFYRNWETTQDAEGRRQLAQLALSISERQEEPPVRRSLVSLVDRAIPDGSIFFIDPFECEGYEQPGSGWRLRRHEVLASGSFNLVFAADIHVVQTSQPEAHQVDSHGSQGVVARLLGRLGRCVGGLNCLGRRSARRLRRSRARSGGAAEEPNEGREVTTLLPVALRLPFIHSRQGSALNAGSLIRDRVQKHYITKLFPSGVRTDELIEIYGFEVPLVLGRARGMPDVLASDNLDSLLNFFEVHPRLICDLSIIGVVTNRFGLLFLLKRVIQLATHLAAAGIVHTDIKMENVLIDHTGQLYLSDFDLAHKVGDTVECGDLPAPDFSDPDTAHCFLMTPEKRISLTAALDTWSFGILLVEVACEELKLGGHNLERASRVERVHQVASLRRSRVRTESGGDNSSLVDWTGCGDVPEEYKTIVGRMLNPRKRTRLNPLDFYQTSPLFSAARRAQMTAATRPAGQQRTR